MTTEAADLEKQVILIVNIPSIHHYIHVHVVFMF